MSVSVERVAEAAALLRVPEDRAAALALTYEEAQGTYSQDEREQVARHLLWSAGSCHGYEPGGFTQSLLLAWGRADNLNSARLAIAFPIYADGKDVLTREGRDGLLKWAGIESR